MSLRIEALSRQTFARRVLDQISLEVPQGEFLALLGPVGSGRATLLRVIAGLEEADGGRILLDGRDITRLPPRRRGIGFAYQHDPLFNHPTVFEAVAAALPESADGGRPDPAACAPQVNHLLGLVGLAEDGGWMPAMLPPGKRHRLLLARTLATAPRLLLVGERFGVPAPPQRPAPRRWLRELHRRLGLTTIAIAQDAAEALALADRIAVLHGGRVEQVASPAELLRRPASPQVAQALGGVAGEVAGGLGPPPDQPWTGAIEVVDAGSGAPARVLSSTAFGATLRLELQLLSDGTQLEAEVPSNGLATALPPGSIVGLRRRGLRMPWGETPGA